MEHLYFFEGHEAAAHHLVEDGKELVNFLFTVDNLDDQRQVHGEAQDFGGMQAARFAKSHGASQNGGAGEMHLARFQYDRFIERLMMPAITFTEKDAKQDGVLGDLHLSLPSLG